MVSHLFLLLALAASDTTISGADSVAEVPRLPERSALSVGAAVVPGVLLHGSGHFAGGDRRTAYRLFGAEAVGAGLLAVGVGGLAVTGASRRTVEPLIWSTMGGVGLLATSWLADLYGVLAPPGGGGDPLRVLPTLEARVGGRYVADPTVTGSALGGAGADVRFGRLRFSPGAWIAAGSGRNDRYEAELAFRIIGPRAGASAVATDDGSFLDVVAGGVHHRYEEDVSAPLSTAFDMTSFELRLDGRYDLRRTAPSLTGAFVDAGVGSAIGAYHYRESATTEANTFLLGTFGFGIYLGRRAERWGEARVYYDHRHDDYAGGFKTSGIGSGPLGHFGADGRAFVTAHWGVRAEVQWGAAWVGGLSLVYRYGRVAL